MMFYDEMCKVKSAPQDMTSDMMCRNHEIKGAKSPKHIPNEIHFNHLLFTAMFDTYNQLVSESVVTYQGWVPKEPVAGQHP